MQIKLCRTQDTQINNQPIDAQLCLLRRKTGSLSKMEVKEILYVQERPAWSRLELTVGKGKDAILVINLSLLPSKYSEAESITSLLYCRQMLVAQDRVLLYLTPLNKSNFKLHSKINKVR
jgi:hypothetical protein